MTPVASPERRHPVSQELFDLYLRLHDTWPRLFNLHRPKPLQIGIDKAIQVHFALSESNLKSLMRWYTGRKAYLEAMVKATHRYGLDGEPVAELTENEQRYAYSRLHRKPPKAPAQEASSAPKQKPSSDAAVLSQPVNIWDELIKRKDELAMQSEINATLKVILREKPQLRASEDGAVLYSAMQNVPKGLPANATLSSAPLYLAIPTKMWNKSQKQAEQIESEGKPVWWMVEGAVGLGADGLLVYAKSVQAIAGKVKAA